jgi:transcriptional regulator of acetoin/glycerol metabolism
MRDGLDDLLGSLAALGHSMRGGSPPAASSKEIVLDALRTARGNKSRAARVLGLTRSQLYTRLKRFGLDAD